MHVDHVNLKKKHLPKLKEVHTLCKFIEAHLRTKYLPLGGFEIKMGYHLNPSMDDLHIHIISSDFSYSLTKNQKKSFNSFNFITIDAVEKELEEKGFIEQRAQGCKKSIKKQKYIEFFKKNTRVYKVC
jgi:hypothetical protein